MKGPLPTPRPSKRGVSTPPPKVILEQLSRFTLLAKLKRISALTHTSHALAAADKALKGPDVWYRASYDFFMSRQNRDPASTTEFLKRVAYAYSWVPTIARADPRTHFVKVQIAVEQVRDAESRIPYSIERVRKARSNLLKTVQRALMIDDDNGATVVASKVMHFWDRKLAPMIDTNIAQAWKTPFCSSSISLTAP
jgi:hypothetical protein